MASIKLKGDTSGEITIQAPSVAGTNTLNLQASSGTLATTAQASIGMKNRVINGNMIVNQRGGTITVNNASDNYGIDRWQGRGTASDGIFTTVQDTESPTGFTNSAKITVTTADTSIGTSERYEYRHRIEGYNIADLAWGSSNAKTVTLSFWVRSSVTGTFGGSFTNSAGNRSYVFSYTITSANTWEQKTITVAGDTSGTWLTNNGIGINLSFSLGHGSDYVQNAGSWYASYEAAVTGQTNLIATNAATWYLTGVQFEQSENATPFENRSYGTELAMCQRYFIKTNPDDLARPTFLHGLHFANNASLAALYANLPTRMRTAPSITRGGTNDNFWNPGYSASATANFNPTYTLSTPDGLFIELSSISVGANSAPIGYNGQLSLNAEL